MKFLSRFFRPRPPPCQQPSQPQSPPLPSTNAAFIVADPEKRLADREEDGESRFVRSARLLAYLLAKSDAKYAVRLEHPHHALRALDILEALDAHLDAWYRAAQELPPTKTPPQFLCILCGHGTKGGIVTYPDERHICDGGPDCPSRGWTCASFYHPYRHLYTDFVASFDAHSSIWCGGSGEHVLEENARCSLPYEAIFRLFKRYPGRKALIIEACHSGSFVPALLATSPRELIVVSASGATESAHGQHLVDFIATRVRDDAPTELQAILDHLPATITAQQPSVWIVTSDGHLLASKDFAFLQQRSELTMVEGRDPPRAIPPPDLAMVVVPFDRRSRSSDTGTGGGPLTEPEDAGVRRGC